MNLAYLRRYRLVYLASAYTKRPNLDTACREAAQAAAELMRAGVCVFSPIAHSHTIATLAGINPTDHAFWMEQDRPLQAACEAMVILKTEGWLESTGISAEIAQAYIQKQPIYGLDPETMTLTKWGFG